MRRRAEKKWMKRLRRISRENFLIGDQVHLQNMKTMRWSLKGMVDDIMVVKEGGAKSYLVQTEEGKIFLRNGRYICIHWSKIQFGKGKWMSFALGESRRAPWGLHFQLLLRYLAKLRIAFY